MTELAADTGAGDLGTVEQAMATYRTELTGYCYRMLGSSFDAEDAVQETMVRAWKSFDKFEGRSSVRSWLYRIATNVCLTSLDGRNRRARPMDLGGPGQPEVSQLGDPRGEATWLQPMPDALVVPEDGDPAELAVARESIRLAFVAALQHLPAKQRAVLILCEVLRWQAAEVAELLDTSTASVNSALQRARSTLAARDISNRREPIDAEQKALLAKYVDAFERYDITALVTLLHEDAVMSMPPFDFWLEGPDEMGKWFLGEGSVCRGARLLATSANGGLAFGSYHVDPAGGHAPWSIQVLEVSDGRIIGHHNFLDTSLFEVFGLPAHLDA